MNLQTGIRQLWVLLFAPILAITCATRDVSASTVFKMALPRLVQQADSIVQGRVDHVEVKWEENLAFSYIYINVEDPMKGERRGTVVIRQVGGKIGALNVEVSGMPKFAKDLEVIVFLEARRDGTFQVLGMNQGKYEITDDYAVSNVSGIDVYNPKTGRIETAAFVEKAPLESLKARIRELLK